MKKFFENKMTRRAAKISALFFAASLALFSCDNFSSGDFSSGDFSSGGGTGAVPDASKAYIKIAGVQTKGTVGTSKTVLPNPLTVDDFTDWVLERRITEAWTPIASADTLADLTDCVIEVQNPSSDGDIFKLKAKKDGVQFASDSVDATLTPGVAAELSFTLTPREDKPGSLSVKVNFTGNAAAADWTMMYDTGALVPGLAGSFEKSGAGGSVTVRADTVESGTYTLNINFYGDEAKTIPLNTYSELVRIMPGCQSGAERDIDLNALYKITYHNLPESYIIEGGGTLPLNYSRKSGDGPTGEIMLPSVASSGKYFAGWYTSADFAPDSSVSMILAINASDVDLYACLADTFYVAASGGDDDLHSGYSSNQAFASVDKAIGLISSIGITQDPDTGDPLYAHMDWTIVIDGAVVGNPNPDPNGTLVLDGLLDSRAGSVTLKGARGNAYDSLTSTGKGTAIAVSTSTPICIEGLKIFGGMTDNGGGIKLSADDFGNPSKVTLKAGALVTGNECSTNGGGVLIEHGELVMESGSVIEGNTVGASGKGAGVYAVPASGKTAKVTMKGSARFGNTDYVCLGGGATINIADSLTEETALVATIEPATYSAVQVVTNGKTPAFSADEFAAQCAKFAVKPNGTKVWIVNGEGKLAKENSGGGSAPEGFVPVSGITITSTNYNEMVGAETAANSEVFISGREITIPNLYVCDHEVTQGEYEQYMNYVGSNQSTMIPNETQGVGQNYPVYCVCWTEACMYCNLRSVADDLDPVYYITRDGNDIYDIDEWKNILKYQEWGTEKNLIVVADGKYSLDSSSGVLDNLDSDESQIKMDTGANGYRLLTEAEWEYCARGGNLTGSQTAYSGSDTLANVGWHDDTKVHEVRTANGGAYDSPNPESANDLGIYDMSGNVREWCYDWQYNITSATPGIISNFVASSGRGKIARGGSVYEGETLVEYLTVYKRLGSNLEYNSKHVGFRICRNQ